MYFAANIDVFRMIIPNRFEMELLRLKIILARLLLYRFAMHFSNDRPTSAYSMRVYMLVLIPLPAREKEVLIVYVAFVRASTLL